MPVDILSDQYIKGMNMANANTEHSRALRQRTAAAWKKKLTAANKFEVQSKDAEKIQAIKDMLATIEGKTNTDKLLLVLDTYLKSEK